MLHPKQNNMQKFMLLQQQTIVVNHATTEAKQIVIPNATPVAIQVVIYATPVARQIVVVYNVTPVAIQPVMHVTPVAQQLVVDEATSVTAKIVVTNMLPSTNTNCSI